MNFLLSSLFDGFLKIEKMPFFWFLFCRSDIQEGEDYEILPDNAWLLLHMWYDGGPPIEREVILRGILMFFCI